MTKIRTLALSCFLALALIVPASAQKILTNTTLASAVTTGNARIINLTSATGVSAPNPSTPSSYTFLFVDRELMDVEAVNGTQVTVIRGAESTQGTPHLSGAVVFVVPAYLATNVGGGAQGTGPAVPAGSCTRANELVLPRIQFASGTISDCLNGQWINGDASQTTRVHSKVMYAPNPGGTIYTSLNTNGTTLVAGTFYCTEIQLPYSKLATGLAVLNGTTATTDNHLVALYDAGMNLLANSAVAGVTASGASAYQQISFTTPYYMVGPGQYFGCVQSNGTTATIRMLVTSVQDQYLTTSKTGVFGTIPATITAPTTFTTAVGPYFGIF